MDNRRVEAIAEGLRVWTESREARREGMEDLILWAEQAVSRARAAIERAEWLRSALSGDRSGFGPLSRRRF
jgi:hypothetical protein